MVLVKPYEKEFVLEKINEYNKKIKLGKSGRHEILKKDGIKENMNGYLHDIDEDIDMPVLELRSDDKYWMRLDIREVESTYFIIKNAHGNVGIVGLGLGYTVNEIAKNKKVKSVTVYEFSEDVIKLYENSFKKNPKIKIVKGDAYKAKAKTFDYFFVDIYEYKLSDKVVSDYEFFNKLHKIEDYVFWGVEHFLLSCSYEEIVWVYIPELWMELSKNIFSRVQEAGYLETYKQLDSNLVHEVLSKFKKVLNSNME